MGTADKQLNLRTSIIISVIVLLICLTGAYILIYRVEQIHQSPQNQGTKDAMSLLAAILGILAGGCIAGLFAFEYCDVEPKEKKSIVSVAWLFISSIFLLIFLSMYCMQKIGAFSMMDKWAIVLLFVATFAILDGIVLLERWDATTLPD